MPPSVFVVIEEEPTHDTAPFVVLAVCSTQEGADTVVDARKAAYGGLMHMSQALVDSMIANGSLSWTVEELTIDSPCGWIDPNEASDG